MTPSKNEEALDVLTEHRRSYPAAETPHPSHSAHSIASRLYGYRASCLDPGGMKCVAGSEREALEDISIIFTDVLCCIPLPELLAFIRLHEAGSGQRQDPTLQLAHGKFGFPKNQSSRSDGLHLGVQTPSLKSQLKNADSDVEETKISILSVGRSPAIGMYDATVRGAKGGALAMIGKLASSMTMGVTSMAWKNGRKVLKRGVRSWWSGSKDEEVLPAESTSLGVDWPSLQTI